MLYTVRHSHINAKKEERLSSERLRIGAYKKSLWKKKKKKKQKKKKKKMMMMMMRETERQRDRDRRRRS